MEKASFSDFIVWASPAAFGLALYLAHEAFSTVKAELKDLRERQSKTREDLSEIRADVRSVADSVNSVKSISDASATTISRLDIRSGDTREMTMFMRTIENKLSIHEANYGKVILILKKVVTILRPKTPQDPTQGPK